MKARREAPAAVVEDVDPRLGLDLLSVALNPADSTWQPLMLRPRRRLTFSTEAEVEQYAARLLSSQPHLRLRIVSVD